MLKGMELKQKQAGKARLNITETNINKSIETIKSCTRTMSHKKAEMGLSIKANLILCLEIRLDNI